MKRLTLKPFSPIALSLAFLLGLFAAACSDNTPKVEKRAHNDQLAGTWELKARIAGSLESPAKERFIRLNLKPDGTFAADFRGEAHQHWIRAGEGGFSYEPPLLSFFWDSGAAVTFLVTELAADRMKLHRGRNLAPLKEQEPEEVFIRRKIEKGPTRKPS
jgi:hypothetical protein